jgi:dTDP-4-dehydrorhamnose reductase
MSKKPLLVIGANGQVGRALAVALSGDNAIFWSREEVDLADKAALEAALTSTPCRGIINAAAYTAVDKAEEEEALALQINAEAPTIMAAFCAQKKIPFVHYSTDYVFDGSGDTPRAENAKTAPLNAYGRSKLAGEKAVMEAGGNALIFRTSWVYDSEGSNFLTTMLRLGRDRESLRIVNDQVGAPCYAPHIARATLKCLKQAEEMEIFPSGIYHMTNRGHTSWYGFAYAIFEEARAKGWPVAVKELQPIPSSEYPTPAKRPLNSRLDCGKLEQTFSVTLPDWREGLRECMEGME